MTHTFKRFVGLLLAVMLIFSVCTVAFAEESTELTANDLGVTAGTDIALYDDPVVAGEKVFKLSAHNNSRPSFELADTVDNTKPFEPVAGKHYTVKFDYYLEADTNALDFGLNYGAISAWDSNYDKKLITTCKKSGFSTNFIGDGKWHTGAISFTAAEVKGKVDGVADQVLPYLYLTYYAAKGKVMEGYLKNITIIEDDAAVNFSNDTYNLGYYIDENGATKENLTYKYEKNDVPFATTKISKNNAGEYVVTPDSDTFEVTTNKLKTAAYEYLSLPSSTGELAGSHNSTGAWNIVFVVKYKVTKIGDSGFAGLGVGRASKTYTETCLYNSIQHTSTTSEWKYYLATIQAYADNKFKLRLVVAGIGSEIVIDTVQVAFAGYNHTKTKTGYNTGITCYNDNGAFKVYAQYDGTSLIYAPENGYMGEESDTWCSDQALTTPTEITAVDNTTYATDTKSSVKMVYAKYDTVVIDTFPTSMSFVKDWDYNCTSATNNYDSVALSSYGANAMFMVPAYSGYGSTGSGAYEYYQFTKGAKYHFVVEVSGISVAPDTTNGIELIAATSAGQSDGRDDGNIKSLAANLDGTVTSMTISKTLTYNSELGDAGYAFRNSNSEAKIDFSIDKIIITKVTENTNFSLVNIDGELTAVNLGTELDLPAMADTETEMFVGWYRSDTNMGKADTKLFISTSDIALPGVYLADAFEYVTLVPKYISKASQSIDFSETDYEDIKGADIGSAHSIVVNESIDADSDDDTYLHANSSKSDFFKTSLFSEAGRVVAVEGVTYRFEIRYKVVKALNTNGRSKGYIGICRNPVKNYLPNALDGSGVEAPQFIKATSVTDGFVTYIGDITNKYMYKADNKDSFLNSQLSIMIPDGEVYVDYVKVTPVSFAYTNVDYDTTKGTIDVDYANGTLKVIPATGYKLSTKGVTVQMNYRDYVAGNTATPKSIEADSAPEILTLKTTDNVNFTFNTDYADFAKKIGALVITAEFVEETAVDGNIIAASVRHEDVNAATYVSAGIRFRGRISAEDVNGAAEVGFVAIPVNAMSGYDNISHYMEDDGSAALKGIAYNAAANKNVVYNTLKDANDNVTYYDYQLLIKGLTKKDDSSVDLTGLKLNVAMYITDAEGNTRYLPGVYGIAYSDFTN